jgi:hypothetical protein
VTDWNVKPKSVNEPVGAVGEGEHGIVIELHIAKTAVTFPAAFESVRFVTPMTALSGPLTFGSLARFTFVLSKVTSTRANAIRDAPAFTTIPTFVLGGIFPDDGLNESCAVAA